MNKTKVRILMGSDSDLGIMQQAGKALDLFDVAYEITVASAHRSPERVIEYVKDAQKNNAVIFIAGAGGAAHLAGVVAALTTNPVIGVPIKAKNLDGLDSLLSIAQMPQGVPVATVAIDGAFNAGLLAVQILGISDKHIQTRLKEYKKSLSNGVSEKAEKIKSLGVEKYLADKK